MFDKIGVKQLDLYLIHTPKAIQNGDYEGTWRTFEKIQDDGFAKLVIPFVAALLSYTKPICLRNIGVSNFEVTDLQKLLKNAKIKPVVNQVCQNSLQTDASDHYLLSSTQIRLHPYNIAENADLLDYHKKHGIVTEAYGSLA